MGTLWPLGALPALSILGIQVGEGDGVHILLIVVGLAVCIFAAWNAQREKKGQKKDK